MGDPLYPKSDLVMYLDFHGHSRRTNLFAYGCSTYAKDDPRFFMVRMYPKIISLLAGPEFSYRCCRFGGGGMSKRGTGRVVVAKDVGLTESFTIEASFYGAEETTSYSMGKNSKKMKSEKNSKPVESP